MSRLLQINNITFEWKNFNNDFLILKSENKAALNNLAKEIFQRKFEFVEEVIVTEVEICLKLNMFFEDSKIALLKNLSFEGSEKQYIYKLPIYFSAHEDWDLVEETTQLLKAEIIQKLLATEFTIAMFGFLPGFIYMDGLHHSLHVPRKTIPSKYVKANALAIGGKYLGLYSIDSPGGWHVIGQTPISIIEIPKLPPVELNLGDVIKLHAISEEEYVRLLKNPMSIIEYNA